MKLKPNILRPGPIIFHKELIPLGPLVAAVARQHALQAHAHALDVLHGAPARLVQQIKADDAVAVHVRVHRDRPRRVGEWDERHLRRLDRVVGREAEAQAEGLVEV